MRTTSIFRARLQHLRRDERGMSFVFVSMGMMAFVSAAMLTIDVGQIMTARTQAQRSADAGALAGATALVFNDFNDRSASGPAKSSAVNTARANLVIDQVPSVNPSDVNFIMNPETGREDIIEVTVYRNGARGNPVLNFIGPIFGMDTADISATARAAAIPAGSEICVLPLTVPDRWIEHQTGPWDPEDTFDMYASQGQRQNVGAPLVPPDEYVPPGSTTATPTGYHPVRDKGMRLVLKNNNQNKVAPGMYNAWDLPGSTGGDDYRENITTCNPNLVTIGDTMTPENGNMVGPTADGVESLMLQDQGARWDDGCNCVVGSNPRFKVTPRIRILPLYDPVLYTDGQHTGKSQPELRVVNYLGIFIEQFNSGGEIIGRITPITGRRTPGSGAPPVGAFAQAIMLVK